MLTADHGSSGRLLPQVRSTQRRRKPMPNRPVRRRLVRLLGSLPLIADFAHRLGIPAIIDQTCPSRENAHLTHGQVAYPPEEQHPDYPRPAYGFGGEPHCKQLRIGELVTNDGGVPVWHHSYDGNQADVGTVVAQMEAFRAQLPLPECLVIGDSKLLSGAVIGKLRRQHLHFLAPLPASAELDRAFLALDPAGWEPLDYVAQRQE